MITEAIGSLVDDESIESESPLDTIQKPDVTTKPRLAVVYHFLPNYRQGVFDALANNPDWDVTFITGHSRPGQEGVPEAENLHPIEVQNRWLAGRFLWQQGLLPALRHHDYDAVIFLGNWMWATNWLSALRLRRGNKAVLHWTHGWIEEEPGLQGMIRRRFYKLADKLLLYGHRAAEIGASYGWKAEDLVVIGNSLPLPEADGPVDPWQSDQLTDPSLPLAVWIARLIPEKKPEMVIDAVALAEQRGHPVNLVFIGGGDESGALAQLAQKTAPGRIVFAGPIHDDNELASIFAAGSVTVVPDYAGLTVPHSLIHGVPVVANDDPAANGPDYEYLYPETNGSVFPRGDLERFADEMIRWAYTEEMPDERRAAIVEQARIDASPELGAERILAATREVLVSRGYQFD